RLKYSPPTSRESVWVCQQSKKGQVEQFLHKFVHGIKPLPPPPPRDRGRLPKRQTNYFEKGFCRKYALQDVHHEFFLAEGSSVDSYRKACQRALEKLVAGQKWDLAIVQIEEPFHQLTAQCNPYFVCKVSFHTHQIPVQEFEIETTRRPDKELIYVLNNMGLATYAKLEQFQCRCIVDSGETLRQTDNGEIVWGRPAAQA